MPDISMDRSKVDEDRLAVPNKGRALLGIKYKCMPIVGTSADG